MSQHKTLTNLEKGKLLREIRKRIGWTQKEMADQFHLDSTYLSQLENGHREIDDYYLERALDFEKLKKGKGGTADVPFNPTRHGCIEYLESFLETCGEDHAKLGWTLIELREHFPLDKWVSSSLDDVAKAAGSKAVASVENPGVVYGRSRKAASTSGKTSSPASRAGERSNVPQPPEDHVPK